MKNSHMTGLTERHGAYIISSSGVSWSHLSEEKNALNLSFKFRTNDIIYMEFDPFEKKIRFRKNEGNSDYERYER